jgi:tetratricopeptide (TPR) repeat protein
MKFRDMMHIANAVGSGDTHRIEAICKPAIDQNPADFFALMTLADAYWRDENYEKALPFALRALEIESGYFHALRVAAYSYDHQEDHERAYACAKRLLSADRPVRPPAKLASRLLYPLTWIPRVRIMKQRIEREDTSDFQALGWAKDYVAWYESRPT